MKKVIGIDLGGTTIKFAILTQQGEMVQKWSIDTDVQNEGKKIVPDIIQSIHHHLHSLGLSPKDIIGIGMGSPGAIDRQKGTVIGAYNLNWSKLQQVRTLIESGTNIPVFIDNDANVAALGELWKGAGEGVHNMVFVTLGTGVGGGVIVEGNLVHGKGASGEIGHIIVDPNGYQCTCGNQGCLETVASATGVIRLARDMIEKFSGESSLKGLMNAGQEVTSKEIFNHAKQGDKFAEMVLNQFYSYLGLACANIANVLNPDYIVIGGGVSAAGDMLINGVEAYFQKYAYPPVRTTTQIRLATLGNEAGVIGAASLVILSK